MTRCWQIMTNRPRGTVNQQTRWTRKIQSKAFFSQPVDPEDLEAHVLAHSSERGNSDSEGDASKVETQKTEAQCSFLFPQKPKEIYSANRKVWWLDNSSAQSPQRRTWISEQSPIRCRGTSSRHSVESVSNQNFTRVGEEFTNVYRNCRRSLKVFVRTFIRIWQVLWRIIMELSNNYTSSIRNKRNCRTSCTSNNRRDISRIIAICIGW